MSEHDLKLWTMKDIASHLGVSVRTVARYEDEWGLREIRIRTRSSSVWYFKSKVISLLSKLDKAVIHSHD
jgi:hypothetical protein